MSTLDRLEDLHRDATPGPWGCDEQALPEIAPFCLDEDEPGSGELILDWSREIAATVSSRTDAELIVEVRNALPALLTIVRAAQEAVTNDPSKLAGSVNHADTCAVYVELDDVGSPLAVFEDDCDCGLTALRAALAALERTQ